VVERTVDAQFGQHSSSNESLLLRQRMSGHQRGARSGELQLPGLAGILGAIDEAVVIYDENKTTTSNTQMKLGNRSSNRMHSCRGCLDSRTVLTSGVADRVRRAGDLVEVEVGG
jgi:cysteine sulfinate desulfinase/cysteine desulfurase-like protein